MIIHREALDDWGAYKTAGAMDQMGHKIISIVCKPATTNIIAVPEHWHIFSQGEEIDTTELDAIINT